ncbi:TetR/AcrR family transcriptional regulator [Qipengyuania profundimaris]|uniref:TetR/AcrR family transcriptional regulator n=1 Tax=Qipengyuania profundimaris TaxID=3067652 RepID=A0ABT9HSY0_9SPHN|nr:TetR/AcrR family transcriptional regulator [Qipengyuania sp. G39]MDP4576271.1 TetR/AcrR family transcriptional regulator [Qipengyuania sp. G39]
MIEHDEFCRLDRRKRAIIEAARTLFVEQGFERTTLGDIVDRAGGSLATIYKLFGNKDGLLEAVVLEKASSGETLVSEALEQGGDPPAILLRLAEGLHSHFLEPEVVALVRIVIARSVSDREFARVFFERTATRTRQAVEQMFVSWKMNGATMHGSPAMLAEMFLGIFVSDLHAEAISHRIAVNHTPQRLRDQVDFFIAGAGLSSFSEAHR